MHWPQLKPFNNRIYKRENLTSRALYRSHFIIATSSRLFSFMMTVLKLQFISWTLDIVKSFSSVQSWRRIKLITSIPVYFSMPKMWSQWTLSIKNKNFDPLSTFEEKCSLFSNFPLFWTISVSCKFKMILCDFHWVSFKKIKLELTVLWSTESSNGVSKTGLSARDFGFTGPETHATYPLPNTIGKNFKTA